MLHDPRLEDAGQGDGIDVDHTSYNETILELVTPTKLYLTRLYYNISRRRLHTIKQNQATA